MASVNHHYDTHLGPVYRWMVGDMPSAMGRIREDFRALGLRPDMPGLAVDLGAGIGLHAIPLAELGFSVVAVEACGVLAEELREGAADLPIRVVEGDLLDFIEHCDGPVDAILCMGDTLTHLASAGVVERLLGVIAGALATAGVFIATFRDYSGAPLEGAGRFINVRSDETRILTCFLEYGPDVVTVHDLLHQRTGGAWDLRVSSYPKVRLDPRRVVEVLEAAGLAVQSGVIAGGMVQVIARKG